MNLAAEAGALEASCPFYECYLQYPRLHGNPEVLRLLGTVGREVESDEDENEKQLEDEREHGEQEGWETCKREELKPLVDLCHALLACINAPRTKEGRKLKAELAEAAQGLELAVADIERRLKL